LTIISKEEHSRSGNKIKVEIIKFYGQLYQ